MTRTPEPPADVAVEAAVSEDVETMADLWVELARDQRRYGSHLLPEANRSRIREMLLQHVITDTALVARRGGAIIGFVTFSEETESFQQDVTRGIVHNIYVQSSDRNDGVGSELLATAERSLAERDVDAISLQVMAENDTARRFYRRHGYEPHRIEMEKPVENDRLTTDD